jgi:hypothetical protein
MTSEQKHKIIEIFAYNYSEICKANGVYHDDTYIWKQAERFLEIDQEINGEDFLLVMLEPEIKLTLEEEQEWQQLIKDSNNLK